MLVPGGEASLAHAPAQASGRGQGRGQVAGASSGQVSTECLAWGTCPRSLGDCLSIL